MRLTPLLLALLPTVALAGRAAPPPVDTTGALGARPGRVIRDDFDGDPSSWVGRFVLPGRVPSESASVRTVCSDYIRPREVAASGLHYDELLTAGASASASLSLVPFAGLSAAGERSSLVRITYDSTSKLVGQIDDPAGLEACCKVAADRCPGPYIAEYLAGTGSLWKAEGREAGGKLSADTPAMGAVPPVGAEVELSRGISWRRAMSWDSPLYFAFKTAEVGFSPVATEPGCGDWIHTPPRSGGGKYFVGVSESQTSERLARREAMLDARVQGVEHLATEVGTGGAWTADWEGAPQDVQALVTDTAWIEHTAAGEAALVKDENWCVQADESSPDADATRYKVWVLAWMPTASEDSARRELGWEREEE